MEVSIHSYLSCYQNQLTLVFSLLSSTMVDQMLKLESFHMSAWLHTKSNVDEIHVTSVDF